MKSLNKIFTGILCGALVATRVMAADDCSNLAYKQAHPERCQYTKSPESSNLLLWSGGAVAIGGIAALIGVAAGGNGGGASSNPSIPSASSTYSVRSILPTTIARTGTAPDFTDTDAELTSIKSSENYKRNANAYDDIRLAYSIARGYTGAGTKIAVFDTARGTFINDGGYSETQHSEQVLGVATGPIAPNAVVEHYTIAYNKNSYFSYQQIGDIIASANDANVYNNSWNVSEITADKINEIDDLVKPTSANFVNAISDAAANKDAIFVWSAGNDYGTQSGMLSAMPRVVPELNGHFVNVVAWDNDTSALADYSNACGVTKDYCITAPGTIKTPRPNSRFNDVNVGTSFAAPVVSAAIAVIREAWPYLNAAQITDILFTTAADLGDAGVDEIYGHGMLDMEAATRPVGELSIAISDNVIQPMQIATVSPEIAHAIKSASPTVASFDAYGRAFDTKLSDNVAVRNRGLGFERLRGDDNRAKISVGAMEFGFYRSDILKGTGFLATDDKTTTSYIAANKSFNIGSVELFARSQFGTSHPNASSESIISEFSNIYTASATLGLRGGDWSFSIGVPETIINGNMNLHTASGRTSNGTIIFNDYQINMATAPSIEYTANYRFLTAGFVDNPYGSDECYIFAKTKLKF